MMNAFDPTSSSGPTARQPQHIEAREVDRALQLLYQASQYARDVDQDRWQFAIEIEQLRKLGLTDSALRWLLCKGTIAHAEEITKRDDRFRTFQSLGLCTLTDSACFVLSPGVLDSSESLPGKVEVITHQPHRQPSRRRHGPIDALAPRVPVWDSVRHELRLGDVLVKRFKHRSPNQEAVLTAFQEEGWPYKVDDPLAPIDECDPKRRLSDTIRGLNHHQLEFLVRFRGDGTGEAVVWELAECNSELESAISEDQPRPLKSLSDTSG